MSDNNELVIDTESKKTKKKLSFPKFKKKDKAEKVKKEKVPMTKERKKKLIKRGILIGIPVIILSIVIVSTISAKNTKLPVTTYNVKKGDVEASLSTSGNVESGVEKVFYSKIAADIGEVKVKTGDAVKAGDVLLTYDDTSLALAKEQAQLKATVSNGEYNDTMQKNSKTQGEYSEATTNLKVLEQQITDYEAFIKDQTRKLEDKKSATQATLAARQQEFDKKYPNSSVSGNGLEEKTQLAYDTSTWQFNNQLVDLQRSIDDAKTTLEKLNEYKTEMKSQESGTEDTVLTASAKEAKQANNKMTQIESDDILTNISQVENGLKADFDGVITSVTAMDGSPATDGAELLKMQSTKDVFISISLSKYDLEKVKEGQKADVTIAGNKYEGKVTKINKIAEKNSNNTPVVYAEVQVNNPDENVILGIEAKVNIHAQKAEGVLLIPVEAINSDKNGDFVYTVEKGIVTRKNVVIGVSSDTLAEICEGLKENDQVISTITNGISEGMAVTAIPQVPEE